MKLYFAPLDGLTHPAYRAAHAACFGGVDRYYTPFYSPTADGLSRKDCRELFPFAETPDPCFSSGVPFVETVPQLMTNRAQDFLAAAAQLAAAGFRTVDLNVGCPSGTVTAKKRGAGFLTIPDALDEFLYTVAAALPGRAPGLALSVKTRVGYLSEEEWPRLLSVFARYPMAELIVHPRLRADLYRGRPRMDTFAAAMNAGGTAEIVYNSDIFTVRDAARLREAFPACRALMCGRGALADPALFLALRGNRPADEKERLRRMLDLILEENARRIGTGNWLLARMADLWKYQYFRFEGAEEFPRRIRRAATVAEYRAIVAELFREHPLAADGHFVPPFHA